LYNTWSFWSFSYISLRFTKKSASICDYFIVGIESNANVPTYKSYKRPILDEESRTQVIRELDIVDAVFINHFPLKTEYYTSIYKELYIDYVTIGENFEFVEVIEEQVSKSGAKLISLHTKHSINTTAIINEIIKKYSY